jgi:hypothetical protein
MEPPDTPLKALIDTPSEGYSDQDAVTGNGGHDLCRLLVDFCHHDPPPPSFGTMGETLLVELSLEHKLL